MYITYCIDIQYYFYYDYTMWYFLPDHIIIVGANRQTLTAGGFHQHLKDTLILMKIAEQLHHMVKMSRWLPKRTIKLCSWGGDVAMAQYFEVGELCNTGLAYLNMVHVHM